MARPTTVNRGWPGALVTVIESPSEAKPPRPLASTTICPGRCAQWPDWSATSSTGPPGDERPATDSGGSGTGAGYPLDSSVPEISATANGPAAAVTGARPRVAASADGVTREGSMLATMCAPRCEANARSNGAFESTTSASPSTAEAVDTNSTAAITTVCTRRRRPSPPRTAPATAPGLIIARPRLRDRRPERLGHRRGEPSARRSARPDRGCE